MSLFVGSVQNANGEVWIYRRPKALWRKKETYRSYCVKHGWLTPWRVSNERGEKDDALRHLNRHNMEIIFDTSQMEAYA
jgi:hypothetical protein